MTNAERQQRHRDKLKNQTYEQDKQAMEKMRRQIKSYIDVMTDNELYGLFPLIYCMAERNAVEKELSNLCFKSLAVFSNGEINEAGEFEYTDGGE